MIDSDLIEAQSDAMQTQIKAAILTLSSSGILIAQKQRLFERASEGADSDSVDEVAERVLEYRRRSSGLTELQQLGESFLAELKEHTQ